MARIVLGSYLVRYPLGGMMSWVLQYLVGLQRLGHDVHFVEQAGYPHACYDPVRDVMTDDCSYGMRAADALLRRFGLGDRWCYVDWDGRYHGLSRERVRRLLRAADLFLDMGTHGAWLSDAAGAGARVLIDGEPGFTQMKLAARLADGEPVPEYDAYVTTGRNIGTPNSLAPTAGKIWRPLFHPVVTGLFDGGAAPEGAAYTTVMNWQSYEPLTYDGRVYGHKDIEFERFVELPQHVSVTLEAAVSGKGVPRRRLEDAGWRLADAHAVTHSFDSFVAYVGGSRGEFGVCKNGFVATNSGWFSDRSAAYLASGKPVVLEATGFADHLPCGEGLFAPRDVEEAADALTRIEADYAFHSRRARQIAEEYLEAGVVLRRLLDDLGV